MHDTIIIWFIMILEPFYLWCLRFSFSYSLSKKIFIAVGCLFYMTLFTFSDYHINNTFLKNWLFISQWSITTIYIYLLWTKYRSSFIAFFIFSLFIYFFGNAFFYFCQMYIRLKNIKNVFFCLEEYDPLYLHLIKFTPL